MGAFLPEGLQPRAHTAPLQPLQTQKFKLPTSVCLARCKKQIFYQLTTSNHLSCNGDCLTTNPQIASDTFELVCKRENMEDMDFGRNFIKWVKLIYTWQKAPIIVNGELTKPCEIEEGTKQNSLSQRCYLFQL